MSGTENARPKRPGRPKKEGSEPDVHLPRLAIPYRAEFRAVIKRMREASPFTIKSDSHAAELLMLHAIEDGRLDDSVKSIVKGAIAA